MADTIRKVKVVDDIIATESEVQYGVLVGGQNITAQHFKAISATHRPMPGLAEHHNSRPSRTHVHKFAAPTGETPHKLGGTTREKCVTTRIKMSNAKHDTFAQNETTHLWRTTCVVPAFLRANVCISTFGERGRVGSHD